MLLVKEIREMRLLICSNPFSLNNEYIKKKIKKKTGSQIQIIQILAWLGGHNFLYQGGFLYPDIIVGCTCCIVKLGPVGKCC